MRWTCLASVLGWLAVIGPVQGQAEPSEGFALVVGSNAGGPVQAPLRYAEDDARRVSDVLRTLGGYDAAQVRQLVQPSAAGLRDALDEVRNRIAPLAQSGVRTRFFFYYSGHARADALNLGPEQLPLGELRQAILALPATMSIVVLDGCQSGAFSRVKGAERAADFSWNSVERLNTEGIAVIASSSALELSQESEELRSSYFTHHWLVALRGGGDRDGDGRVTLSEAYQYAYNHTLATTAQTAVGEQHATLETNLRGKDDVALTRPALANTRLRIPPSSKAACSCNACPAGPCSRSSTKHAARRSYWPCPLAATRRRCAAASWRRVARSACTKAARLRCSPSRARACRTRRTQPRAAHTRRLQP